MEAPHRYTTTIYWSDDDEAFIAEVPELKNIPRATGATDHAALAASDNIVQAWLAFCRLSGTPIPEPAPHTGAGEEQPCDIGFMDLAEGEIEPTLNKKIAALIMKHVSFIVFLDEELYVQWCTNDFYGTYADGFGTITNRVAYLESISRSLLSEDQVPTFQRNLAEAMARMLDGEFDNASSILDQAEKYLHDRSVERGRLWYISTAIGTALFLISLGVTYFFIRDRLGVPIGTIRFDVPFAAAFGSLGALISVFLRVKELNLDSLAGKTVHQLEAAIRIVAGTAGAVLVGLAVKANLILGTVNDRGNALTFLIVICIIAGASERVVPNLIRSVEGMIGEAESKGTPPASPERRKKR